MIYLIWEDTGYDSHEISSVYECSVENAEELYKAFMSQLALEIECVINPHWLNIMNHEDHHPEMSKEQYKEKSKQWNLTLRSIPFAAFLRQHCGGTKLEYKNIF